MACGTADTFSQVHPPGPASGGARGTSLRGCPRPGGLSAESAFTPYLGTRNCSWKWGSSDAVCSRLRPAGGAGDVGGPSEALPPPAGPPRDRPSWMAAPILVPLRVPGTGSGTEVSGVCTVFLEFRSRRGGGSCPHRSAFLPGKRLLSVGPSSQAQSGSASLRGMSSASPRRNSAKEEAACVPLRKPKQNRSASVPALWVPHHVSVDSKRMMGSGQVSAPDVRLLTEAAAGAAKPCAEPLLVVAPAVLATERP